MDIIIKVKKFSVIFKMSLIILPPIITLGFLSGMDFLRWWSYTNNRPFYLFITGGEIHLLEFILILLTILYMTFFIPYLTSSWQHYKSWTQNMIRTASLSYLATYIVFGGFLLFYEAIICPIKGCDCEPFCASSVLFVALFINTFILLPICAVLSFIVPNTSSK